MLNRIVGILIAAVITTAAAQTTWREAYRPPNGQSENTSQRLDLRLIHADVPLYPQLARTARASGTVQVEVTVKDGDVVNAEVKSGPPMLTSATVENIRTWRFNPLVNATFTARFIYRLETDKTLDPQNPKVELQLPLLAKITAVPVMLDSQAGHP